MQISIGIIPYLGHKTIILCVEYIRAESIQAAELSKRDADIKELTEKLASECEARQKAEGERDNLQKQLVSIIYNPQNKRSYIIPM